MTDDAAGRIRSVETAFETLEYIRDHGESGITDVATALGVSKSTAYNHLTTLESLGYLVREDGVYRLGLQFLGLGHHARIRYPLYEPAKSEADQLARSTGERCQVMVAEGHHGSYVYQTAGEKAVQTDSHVGADVGLHCTAVGKSYLAHLSESDLESYLADVGLEALTEHTITDSKTLREDLAAIRERGYALNHEERLAGMRAIGAPILADNGEVLGAISVSAPTTRLEEPLHERDLTKQIQRSARVIAIKTTYS